MPLYTLLFNVILETGIMPSKWVEGVVIPIFKNKGDPLSVDNYRPITLLSCIGKLFTAVLNNRLNAYLEEYNLLNENQAGFRSGYSTTDHIFSLNCIIDLLRAQKKKIFCSFITVVIPISLFLLATGTVLRKAAIDRGVRLATGRYGCRYRGVTS